MERRRSGSWRVCGGSFGEGARKEKNDGCSYDSPRSVIVFVVSMSISFKRKVEMGVGREEAGEQRKGLHDGRGWEGNG